LPGRLPALCDTAIRDLAEVNTIGECLNIINVVEAARVYAQKLGLAQEAQDTCRRIVVMAERKIGQELIEAQKRGELRSDAGRPKIVPDENDYASTHEEIGITRKQAHDFRQMAELSDDIEGVMSSARETGKPARKAAFKRKAIAKARGRGVTVC
jgi:hypothetical protein